MTQITGTPQNDLLVGTNADDVIVAQAGDDIIVASPGSDIVNGGEGYDTLTGQTSFSGIDNFGTLISIENIIGSGFDDYISAYIGTDLDGGDGYDVARLRTQESPLLVYGGTVVIDVAQGTWTTEDYTGWYPAQSGTITSIEEFDLDFYSEENDIRATFNGSNGNDILTAGHSNYWTISTGGGDDRIIFNGSEGKIDGGSGTDTVNIELYQDQYNSVVPIDLAAGIVRYESQTGWSEDPYNEGPIYSELTLHLTSIENLEGRDRNDTFLGNDVANLFIGNAGDDILRGRGGDDVLRGGVGADTLDGGDGNDIASFLDLATAVTVDLETGANSAGDTLISIEGAEGTAFDDTLLGSSATNVFIATAGADHIDGRGGRDLVSYVNADGAVTIDLATGTVSGSIGTGDQLLGIELANGGAFNDVINGNATGNLLTGGDGNDILRGLTGNDTLRGGLGADILDGGSGWDTASYTDLAEGVTLNLRDPSQNGAGAAGDSFISIEQFSGTQFDDLLVGNAATANTLFGLGGNDVLEGGTLADTLDGGDGTDLVSYALSNGAIRADFAAGTKTGDAAGDTWISIEGVRGSAFVDVLYGAAGSERFEGGGGNDILRGRGGADHLDGGDGRDLVSYTDAAASVSIDLANHTASGSDAAGDVLISIEDVNAGIGADVLYGDDGANAFRGMDGGDVLRGRGGADTLDGGNGIDLATYSDDAVGVTVNLATGTGSGGDAQGDVLISIENVNGGWANDTLIGSADANTLKGMSGNDRLIGGSNGDELYGGAGADHFVYQAVSDSTTASYKYDIIRDFSQGDSDLIDLSAIDANPNTAGNQSFTYLGAGAFTGAVGEVRSVIQGGNTMVWADINGDMIADMQIVIVGHHYLSSDSFML